MKEHPILMSGEDVRAILAGRKTQTRRVVVPQPAYECTDWTFEAESGDHVIYRGWPHRLIESHGRNKAAAGELTPVRHRCSFGVPGDRLWVRETWCYKADAFGHLMDDILYAADGKDVRHCDRGTNKDGSERSPWCSPTHMPRWASRLTLEVLSVRVQRLQEISEDEARAEGYGVVWGSGCLHRSYAGAWDALNGKRAPWSDNPWVWAIEFRVAAHPERGDEGGQP